MLLRAPAAVLALALALASPALASPWPAISVTRTPETYASSTRLNVDWTVPGGTTDHYLVHWEETANPSQSAWVSVATNSATLTDLKSGTEYEIYVR